MWLLPASLPNPPQPVVCPSTARVPPEYRAPPWLGASGELRACDFETWPFSVLFVQKKVPSWLSSVAAED